ncbi:MAG: exodeoxyribonuclease VII small subunit [Phycisphaerales bacterium]|jgi:exodeoxyribonuclease VII small subunit|nr:exodeoxyribonuclease VII small subunit [Phycisphaerales bacterium]
MAKKSSKQANPVEELRYEELIEQLEAIVDRIESGEAGLEESIKGYEKGVGLVKRARQILDQAEQRVVDLSLDDLDTDADAES